MAIRDNYFPGSSVSRYLIPGERSWDDAVFQSGKPILDAELNFSQDVGKEIRKLFLDRQVPSGWVRGSIPFESYADFSGSATSNRFRMRKRTALVANMPVVVEYSNTTVGGQNEIVLSSAPQYGGPPPNVKRTDFVFLEVWRCVVSSSPRASATTEVITNANLVAGDVLNINGVPLTATAGAPGVDQFQIGVNNAATASNIAAAIMDPANSFDGICEAYTDVSNVALVNLYAADPFAGAAGNAITLALVLTNAGSLQVNGAAGPTTFAGGANTPNKPTQATLYRHGNTQAPSGVNLPDDIADPAIGTETSKRVQVQYRIRVTGSTEAVNFKTQNGFSNTGTVFAQGTQGAPVANYPFVPADGASVVANSSATLYQTVDSGLWIAGSGTEASATALGTVDGFCYAIPLCFVFRRNDAYVGGAGQGFSPLTNTNGALPRTHGGFVNPIIGVIPANTSDRPDGKFHDEILTGDLLDLRRQVVPGGIDLKEELERQIMALMDGNFTTWALDSADKNVLGGGSGYVGGKFLVCNEIGRSGGNGGVSPSSGDTPRGDSIADFDHIRRRFADWPVVERLVLPISPTDTSGAQPGKYVIKYTGGFTTWQEGDILNFDLDALDATGLGDWANAPSGAPVGGGNVTNLWPPGTKVTDVLRVIHDDGNWAGTIDKTVEIQRVTGIGTPHIQITLDRNNLMANGGLPAAAYPLVGTTAGPNANSPRRIWVELEITYPIGSGTTDTPSTALAPNATVYPSGPVVEDNQAQRAGDWESLLRPQYRAGYREIAVEYVSNDGSGAGSGTPITDFVVSDTNLQIRLPRRILGSGTLLTTVTDQNSALNRAVNTGTTEYGSSTRVLTLQGGSPLSGAGQTLCSVEYFAQDPLQNWGAVGYQIACYYQANAPQTVGVQAGAPATVALPATLTVRPLAMSRSLWTGTVSAGGVDLPFPYTNPLDQIPVNGDLSPGTFPAEWVLAANVKISVSDFDSETGLLSLNQMVQVDGNQDFSFSSLDVDSEFRVAFKVSDTSMYRPTAMAQPLSGVANHKVFFPFLARASQDTVYFRKDEVLLVVVSRYGELDNSNVVRFTNSNNETCAAVYRTRGLLLLASE